MQGHDLSAWVLETRHDINEFGLIFHQILFESIHTNPIPIHWNRMNFNTAHPRNVNNADISGVRRDNRFAFLYQRLYDEVNALLCATCDKNVIRTTSNA